jgi:hypothetical protein
VIHDLDDVHHGERSPHLVVLLVRIGRGEIQLSEDRVGKLIEGVRNSVFVDAPQVGNSVIVSSTSMSRIYSVKNSSNTLRRAGRSRRSRQS